MSSVMTQSLSALMGSQREAIFGAVVSFVSSELVQPENLKSIIIKHQKRAVLRTDGLQHLNGFFFLFKSKKKKKKQNKKKNKFLNAFRKKRVAIFLF